MAFDLCFISARGAGFPTGFLAGVHLVKTRDGDWEFHNVNLKHNPECDPSSKRFMRSCRIVDGVDEL